MALTPEEFDTFAKKYAGHNLMDLANAFEELDTKIDGLAEQQKALNKEYEFLEFTALPKKFNEDGAKNIRLASGKQIIQRSDIQVNIAADDRLKAMQWFKDAGLGAMVQEHVPPATLKVWTKSKLDDMQAPPEFIKTHTYTKAVLRS